MVSRNHSHLLPAPSDGAMGAAVHQPTFSHSALQVVWRRRWTLLFSIVLCVGAGLLYLAKATPKYTSTSKIYVEQPPRLLGDVQGVPIAQGSNYLQNQVER